MSSVSIFGLPPAERAAFATSSRLLLCIVTESLLKAIYIPVCSGPSECLIGTAIVLTSVASKHDGPYTSEDIFVILPLRHSPVFKPGSNTEIALLDSLDMLPYVYELRSDSAPISCHNGYAKPIGPHTLEAQLINALSKARCDTAHTILRPSSDPLYLWKKFADGHNIDTDMQEAVAEEFLSSIAWQQYSYEHPPLHKPTFEMSSIEWEQSIIEGHPIHPMHKSRRAMPPLPKIQPGDYDWQHPLIRLAAVPRTSLHIQGQWDELIAPVCTVAEKNAGKPIDVPADHALVPIHTLQIPNIQKKFPHALLLPKEYQVDALAQESLRSVVIPSALESLSLKLAFGVRITSAMRTISPPSAFLGPHFSSDIVPRLTYDRTLLVVQRELASVSSVHPDHEVAKHLAGIVREAYENTCVDMHGERAIVCTGLVEMGYSGEDEIPMVQSVFGLDTEEKRVAWFDKFVDLYLKAFLPSVIANGVAFEAHTQNTLARFDVHTRELKGFIIRDFGGLRIHPPSLIASTELETLDGIIAPGHSVIANTLEDVYARLYHAMIHNHLQQLVRVLRLHYNGVGWSIVRHRLTEQIPRDHQLAKLWLSPEAETLPGKCLLRMRLQGMYRTHLHRPFSNLIHYKGEAK